MHATYVVDRSHEILADSRRWHLSCSHLQIASRSVFYGFLRICAVDNVLCIGLSDQRDRMGLISLRGYVIPFKLERVSGHRRADNVNQGTFLWISGRSNKDSKMCALPWRRAELDEMDVTSGHLLRRV